MLMPPPQQVDHCAAVGEALAVTIIDGRRWLYLSALKFTRLTV